MSNNCMDNNSPPKQYGMISFRQALKQWLDKAERILHRILQATPNLTDSHVLKAMGRRNICVDNCEHTEYADVEGEHTASHTLRKHMDKENNKETNRKFLDKLIDWGKLKNDHELSKCLKIHRSTVSYIRKGERNVTERIILAAYEHMGVPIEVMREWQHELQQELK